jgi:hypothetical protein
MLAGYHNHAGAAKRVAVCSPPLRGLNQTYVTFPSDDNVVKGQRGMITGLNVPLELASVLCALFCAAGVWAGQARAARLPAMPRHPLADWIQPAVLDPVIDLAARRNLKRQAAQAVLHGRIDAQADTAAAHDQVAAIMRAGLRRSDRVTHIAGDGFTIILPGADESAGTRIAERLRGSLNQLRVGARFGVAAGPSSEVGDMLIRRARRALDAAQDRSADYVVAASEIEHVLYLPAPEPRSAASAA